jgi:hypothetical protein
MLDSRSGRLGVGEQSLDKLVSVCRCQFSEKPRYQSIRTVVRNTRVAAVQATLFEPAQARGPWCERISLGGHTCYEYAHG